MDNVLQFPKLANSKITHTEPVTVIMIVDFKKKQLIGETEIDNVQGMIMGQWGEKPVPQKKVA